MTDPVARLAFFIDRNSLEVIRDPEAEEARAALDLLVARCEQAEARIVRLEAALREIAYPFQTNPGGMGQFLPRDIARRALLEMAGPPEQAA